MDYQFAKGVASLKPSIIREILKSSGNTIPLAAGNPAPDAFPVEDIKKIVGKIFEEDPILALQYGISEGYAPLVAKLTELAKERYGVGSENDSLIVVSGAQQVMSLTSQCFVNYGDCIICEEPPLSVHSTASEASVQSSRAFPLTATVSTLKLLKRNFRQKKMLNSFIQFPTSRIPQA